MQKSWKKKKKKKEKIVEFLIIVDKSKTLHTWERLTRPVPRGANDISKTVSGEIEAVTGPLIAGVNIYSR